MRGVHGMNTDMQAIFGPEGPFAKTFPDYEVRRGRRTSQGGYGISVKAPRAASSLQKLLQG